MSVWVLCCNPLQVDSSALIFLNFQSGGVPVHLLETTWTPAARRCLCIKSPTFTCVFWWPTPKLQRRIFRGLEHKQTSALFKRYSRLWQRVSQHKHYIEEKLVKKVILLTVHNVWDLWLEVCLEVSECQLEWIAVLFNKVSNTVKCTFLICGFVITLHPYIQLHVRSPGSTCFTYVTLLLILTITHTDIILGPWVNCIVVHFFFLHCSQTAGLGLDLNLLHLPEHGGPSSRSHSQTNISADFLFFVLLWQSLYWLIIHLLFLKGCNLKFSTKPWEKSKMTQNHNLWMLCLLPLLLHRQRKHKTTRCL